MALTHSPSIVRDGLVLYLDAANPKSYPGSGNTWYDLSGQSNNLSWSTPSPTFTSYNNFLVMDTGPILGSLRAVRSFSYNNLRTGNGEYTAFAFFKPNALTTRKMICSFGPANNNCSGQNVHPITINNDGKFGGGACGGLGTWNDSSGTTPTIDQYWNVCTTYNGTTEIVYVNGNFDKSANMATNTPISNNNAISLGWIRDDGASYTMDANIGIIMIYNRALTESEIKQNFEALRGRYGI